jgi:uncharacterized coiled-coil DUF342 family protein
MPSPPDPPRLIKAHDRADEMTKIVTALHARFDKLHGTLHSLSVQLSDLRAELREITKWISSQNGGH